MTLRVVVSLLAQSWEFRNLVIYKAELKLISSIQGTIDAYGRPSFTAKDNILLDQNKR